MAINYRTDFDPKYGQSVEVSPLVRRVVCNNPGRFTFTGTGTYIVGRGTVAVIDPGPFDREHVDAILAATEGETISHILLTHTHNDHSPATTLLTSETSALVCGSGPHPSSTDEELLASKPTTWDSLLPTPEELKELLASMPVTESLETLAEQEEPGDVGLRLDKALSDGERIAGPGWTLESIDTPGHISNHLCFRLLEEKAVFTGDHIMGWSTTVIPAPDGSMSDYFASLERLIGTDDSVFYPTHGPAVGIDGESPSEFAESLKQHRIDRENQILDQLKIGPSSIPTLVETMYVETPHILYMAAGQSVYSHIVHLAERGIIEPLSGTVNADGTYRLTADVHNS